MSAAPPKVNKNIQIRPFSIPNLNIKGYIIDITSSIPNTDPNNDDIVFIKSMLLFLYEVIIAMIIAMIPHIKMIKTDDKYFDRTIFFLPDGKVEA